MPVRPERQVERETVAVKYGKGVLHLGCQKQCQHAVIAGE